MSLSLLIYVRFALLPSMFELQASSIQVHQNDLDQYKVKRTIRSMVNRLCVSMHLIPLPLGCMLIFAISGNGTILKCHKNKLKIFKYTNNTFGRMIKKKFLNNSDAICCRSSVLNCLLPCAPVFMKIKKIC